MTFDNPVVAGIDLVRQAIQSPDFQAGVQGWIIRRDGSAEFNTVVVRGELFVVDPDGSFVRIFDENPGDGAVIQLRPPNSAGTAITPAEIRSDTDIVFALPALAIVGPDIDGSGAARIYLAADGAANTNKIGISTDEMITEVIGGIGYYEVRAGGVLKLQAGINTAQPLTLSTSAAAGDVRVETDGRLTVAGDVIRSEDGINAPAVTGANDTTTSAANVNLAGGGSITSFSLTKRFASTRIRIDMTASMFTTAVNTAARFAVRINGVDTDVFNLFCNASGQHQYGAGHVYITGVPAGVQTIQGRWRRTVGAGTCTRDPEDWLSIAAAETD